MTNTKKYIGIGAISALMFLTAFGVFYTARANPSFFYRSTSASVATTTLTYITPGLATTTEIYDTGAGTAGSIDTAILAVQFTGSSSPLSILNIALEYSQGGDGLDCKTTPDSCDWYADRFSAGATSTQTISLNTPTTYTITFASSSSQGGLGTASKRNLRILEVKTPARYVRAVFSVPPGSLNGAVWKEFIGKREAR